ncbi:MAG TPA: patatin-like phospholipase family protein, partial [Solirubrobacteraceae bacterium]|nr:patatin-like phospholipase family protein [Solirubrobacteraceae bacterium]
MGKVVKLEPTLQAKAKAKARNARLAARGVGKQASVERRRRPRRDKTALVLGGGGFTGGVYEIGALRALDLLAVNSTVNNFDVYVGTSAGAFIASLCANGVTPDEMMKVVAGQGNLPFKDVDLGDLLHLNLAEFARKGATMPLRAISLARQLISQPGGVSLMDIVMGLADGLPSGLYTGDGIEKYLQKVLSEPGRTDDFGKLDCELYLT